MIETMDPVKRVTYRLYPRPQQLQKLETYRRLHCELYNAALQERRDAWRLRRVSLRKGDQEKQLPEIKRLRPELVQLGGHALQETLRRVDLAFQAFFRRVKRGETPGFPRFKSANRFKGWTYKSPSNWRLLPAEPGQHGALELGGIGRLRVRGRARSAGPAKTCTITQRAGRWYASVVLECTPERSAGGAARALDWGLEHFLTFENGETVENPRFLRKAHAQLQSAQRALSRKKRGSRNRRRAAGVLARVHEKVRQQRTGFLHQVSAALIAGCALVVFEKLSVKNLSASAKGTREKPGRNVKQKAGLNRSILDGAPGAFLQMIRYKAAEAGTEVVEVNPRTLKPSQTCPQCGAVRKKTLAQRVHTCPCGCRMPRDQAAAQVCLQSVLGVGNRPRAGGDALAPPSIHETASESAA
jgi:putative transposase